MDLAAMSNAEQWQEIAEVMSFDVHAVEGATTGTTQMTEDLTEIAAAVVEETGAAEVAELETVQSERVEPRSARVLSIVELRQKLGIEDMPLARSAPLPTTGRPRIVRRREAEAYQELAAG